MIFVDEDAENLYEKANGFTKAMAQSFEAMCFQYGEEVMVIDLRSPYCIILGAELKQDAVDHIYSEFNTRYERKGVGNETLSVIDNELGIWQLFADEGKNLVNIN